MKTHLYCVLPQDERLNLPSGLSGVAGARVRAITVDGVVAWVSDVEREVPVSVDGVRAHDAVVEAALEMGSTPVPARFGQRFADDDACRDALSSRAASVERLVTTVQGFVEMTLVLTPSTRRMLRDLQPVLPEMFDLDSSGTGRRYLEALREREDATGAVRSALDELALQLDIATSGWVVRSATHDQITRLPLRTISHLIARGSIPQYCRAVDEVKPGGEFRFLLIGPRAPYSFCSLAGEPVGTHGMKLAD
jgi:hypothetical protein